jgi:hypothetical protein
MINILRELIRDRKGRIEGVAMADLLQMIWLEKMTCQLQVRFKKKSGTLKIASGELQSASTGDLGGREAAMEMLTWNNVVIELDDHTVPAEHALSGSTEKMLLENLRRRDARKKEDTSKFKIPEAARAKSEPPRMARINVPGLHQAIAALKDGLDGALLASDILFGADMEPVAGWNSRPEATALFGQLALATQKAIHRSGFNGRAKHCLLELRDGNWAVVIPLGHYAWGMLLDGERTRLGKLLNVALPKAVEAFAAAVGGGEQTADEAAHAARDPKEKTDVHFSGPAKPVKKFTHLTREILNRDID